MSWFNSLSYVPRLFKTAALGLLCSASAWAQLPVPGNGPPLPGGLFARRLLAFTLQVNPNGVIDTSGRGYYIFLINAFGQQIEVTDLDSFTDFVRFDGRNFDWFHRQASLPRPGFQFFQAANINVSGRIGSDRRTLEVIFDLGESTNVLNQFVTQPNFAVHVLTCDNYRGAIIGRPIDTLGQGPDFQKNSLQTLRVRSGEGATVPLPQSYPLDALGDFLVHPELPVDFPYNNFDIARFEVTAR